MEPESTAVASRPLSILIVDDSTTMRMVIRRVVSLTEVPVDNIYEARNGREALKVLESKSVQAIFTDINMPVMNGEELLREIAQHEEWNDILRIVVSTDGSKLRREAARNLRVSLYVEKPFRPEVVRDVLVQITSPVG
ncbi:MAG TPA: response regulator [Vicinamibacterales bacterium]|nr:response regulator [Vicinamibacterales bacterium]